MLCFARFRQRRYRRAVPVWCMLRCARYFVLIGALSTAVCPKLGLQAKVAAAIAGYGDSTEDVRDFLRKVFLDGLILSYSYP